MSDVTPDPRYRLDARIATGGMGEVWRATDAVLGREVAVKVLKPEYADDPSFRSRFESEARNAAALHHPNVASVFDFGELQSSQGDDGSHRPYLVMELVRGEPLSALLRGGERMPPATAADLVAQAADGIAAAHELGIVHRDVKPANLLVTPDRTVKITDFGIARAADSVALTRTGQVLGTPQYLSPEQAQGQPATPASDTYSLGVVLYECLAGRRPFDQGSAVATALAHLRDEPPPLPDDVPEHLREVVAVALAKDPGQRFTSASDLASALRGGPVRAGTGTHPGADAPTLVGAGMAGAGAAAGVAAAAAADQHDDGTRVMTGPPTPADAPAGPPEDDDHRRRPAWLPWLAAAVAVLLVLVVVALLARSRDDGTAGDNPSSTTSSTTTPSRHASRTPSQAPSRSPSRSPSTSPSSPSTSPSTETVEVNRDDYVGRPKDEAKHDLEQLGLKVEEEKADNPGDQPPDTVADVSPTGTVDKGSTVTLSVYGPPAPGEGPPPPGKGHGKGEGKKQG